MKRIIVTILLIAALTMPLFGQGATRWNIFQRPTSRWFDGSVGDPAWNWMKDIDSLVAGSGIQGTGENFYVDSGLTRAGDGSNWANALATLDEAVALCTEDNGDFIHIAQTHTEDWTATAGDDVDLDVAGITVIGYGQGETRPLFTADDADGELVIGDASIRIANLRFMASVDSTVHLIEVESDADGFVIYNCEFLEPESANTTDEADDIIQVAAGANKGLIMGCTFYSLSAGANTAIDLTAGVIEDMTIAGNYFNGAWAEGAIFSDDIDLRLRIIGNTVVQLDAAMTPITFDTTASGWMIDNICASKSTTYLIDPGAMMCSGNLWSDTDSADVEAVTMFPSETGVNIWGASQLAQIEGEVVDALETTANLSEIGDKVVADMDANSILADLAGISEIGDKVVADMDANSILADLAGIGEIGDKVVADMDANSILADLAGISEIGDKIVADMDANSVIDDILTDTAAMDTSAELVALVDPNYVSYDAPRFLSDLTGAMGGGDYEAVDDPVIFTVTGDIMVRCMAIVNTTVTSTSSDTLELGVAGDTACVLGQWAADGANGVQNDVWTLDQDPATPSAEMPSQWVIIPNGLDIQLLIDDHDMTAGVIEFYLWWIPLSADAAVVGAAP